MKRLIILAMVGLFLVSCATLAPKLTDTEIDPGPYPDNYENIVRQYLREVLFDPDSLKDFSIDAPPQKIYLRSGYPSYKLRRGQGVYEIKYVWYNAKNRYGGYTGKKPHYFYIRYGQVVMAF